MEHNVAAMKRFRPYHGIALVLILVAGYTLVHRAAGGSHQRVGPGPDGVVRIPVADLSPLEVRFYRFLNAGNQEVRFFVSRDGGGQIQAAFDANEVCYKKKRGYKAEGEWVVCNFCDKAFRIAEINAGGGGCKPIPVPFRLEGEAVVLTEGELLQGWRYFR
jgi:uncharacterized membrane protein